MAENKIFQFALLSSILAHFLFFIGMPQLSFFPSKRVWDSIKISYYKIKEPVSYEAKRALPKKLIGIKPESIAGKLPEIKKEEILKKAEQKEAEKKAEPQPAVDGTQAVKEVKEKKFEAVVGEEKDKGKKEAYIGYYRAVREKIKQCADSNYPKDDGVGGGEVFLSFAVASNGELLQVKVVEARSVDNKLLKGIAINSVRDASPYPRFPDGMSQYQITFTVVISFEVNKESMVR